MDTYSFIAAFGGGLFGTCVGALPAFILTGVIAIAGGIVSMSGAADLSVGYIAFGSFLGPHISFGAAVVAAAFAANKRNNLKSGTDILSSLNGTGDYLVLLVGGIFGVIAYLLNYLYATVLGLPTDTVALTVFTIHVIARYMFGNTGLFGKTNEKREYFSTGKALSYNIILGGGVGLMVGYVAAAMTNAGVDDNLLAVYPVICFGISAVSLIFTQTGFATPTTHHITLPAASAVIMSGNPLMGIIFGIVGSLLGDLAGKTINSSCDTHIDPPATSIFINMFIINAMF